MTSSVRKTAFVLAALVLFFLGALLLPHLNDMRRGYHLTWAELGEQAPPELVLTTTALGGFRGLILNAVAYRAWELKVEGKFWELAQLYEWISQLQPRSEKVWTDLAWNMSYNIVAEIKTPEDRFRWVWRAIESLRDEGLKYNPRSHEIARELAWIFQQKIGRETDEFHRKYMWYFSQMIDGAWGSGQPDLQAIVDQAKATEMDDASRVQNLDELEMAEAFGLDASAWRIDKRDWNQQLAWNALLETYEDVEELADRFNRAGIALRERYATVQALLEDGPPRALEDLGVAPPQKMLEDPRIVAWLHYTFRDARSPREKYQAAVDMYRRIPEKLADAFRSPDYWDARRRIELHLVESRIRMDYKMDPERMLHLEKEFAPMDWRLPEPHAMYWARIALENRRDPVSGKPQDTIDARRIVFFSAQQLYRRGTILFRSENQVGRIMFGFNLDFLKQAEETFGELVAYYREHPEERAAQNIGDAEKQFLEEAVRIMSWAGQNTGAERLYRKLQERYPSDNRHGMPLDDWVAGQVRKMVQEWGRQTQVQAMCGTMLLKGYAHLIVGQTDLAAAYTEQSKQFWNWYREDEIMRQTDKRTESIPTFEELKKLVVDGILRGDYGAMFSPDAIATLRDLLDVAPEEEGTGPDGEPAYTLPDTWLRHGRKESDRTSVETPESVKVSDGNP